MAEKRVERRDKEEGRRIWKASGVEEKEECFHRGVGVPPYLTRSLSLPLFLPHFAVYFFPFLHRKKIMRAGQGREEGKKEIHFLIVKDVLVTKTPYDSYWQIHIALHLIHCSRVLTWDRDIGRTCVWVRCFARRLWDMFVWEVSGENRDFRCVRETSGTTSESQEEMEHFQKELKVSGWVQRLRE